MGSKVGNHEIDNGMAMFNNFKVPYDALLDKRSHITEDGKFKSAIKNDEKRFALMLGGLAKGRMCIVSSAASNMVVALTIAIRYGAVRKQFSANAGGNESSILDYPLHRYRLIPHLAKAFAISNAGWMIVRLFNEVMPLMDEDPECEEGNEFHAILSILKPLSSWWATKAI